MDAVMEFMDAVHRAQAHSLRSPRVQPRKMGRYTRHIKKFISCAELSLADIESTNSKFLWLYINQETFFYGSNAVSSALRSEGMN